jgi:hypothetical protein
VCACVCACVRVCARVCVYVCVSAHRLAGEEPQFHVSPVKKRTRVAVLGGSFDPITDGHLKMACEIINSRCADEVWIVPCGPRPDKPSLRTPVFHRYIMCHLAVNTTFGARYPVKVCDFEVHEPKALATFHLMARLKREYVCRLVRARVIAVDGHVPTTANPARSFLSFLSLSPPPPPPSSHVRHPDQRRVVHCISETPCWGRSEPARESPRPYRAAIARRH